MNATAAIVLLWLAFGASHVAMSSLRFRPRLVSALGERGFQGVYSLVALATFVPLVWVYAVHKHDGAFLWYGGGNIAIRGIVYVGMAAAFALVVAGAASPSPASFLGPSEITVRGAFRIARHPVFMGVGLFGLVHLLGARVHSAELAFFAGFPLFAWVGCRHQDARKLAGGDEGFRRFHAETPFWPFTGGATGQGLREAAVPLAVGVAVAAALRWFHPVLFGGA